MRFHWAPQMTMLLATTRILLVTALLLPVACCAHTASAAEQTFRPGHAVYTRRSTPLKSGTTELLKIESDTRLLVDEVRGAWVRVAVRRGSKTVTGWVAAKDLQENPLALLLDYSRHMCCADFMAAAADMTQSPNIPADSVAMASFLGPAHYGAQQYEQACAAIDAALKANPTARELHFERAIVRNAMGRYEEALADCTEAIQGGYPPRLAYAERAIAHYRLGHVAQSIEDCTKAIDLEKQIALKQKSRDMAADDVSNVPAYYLIRGRLLRLGYLRQILKPDDVIRALSQTTAPPAQQPPITAQFAEPYRIRGLALESQGKDVAAFADFLEAVRRTGDPESLLGIARILEREGRNQESLIANHLAGVFLLAAGEFDRARDCLDRTVDMAPDGIAQEYVGPACLLRAVTQWLAGGPDKAVAELDRWTARLEGRVDEQDREKVISAFHLPKALFTRGFQDASESLGAGGLDTPAQPCFAGTIHLLAGHLADANAAFRQASGDSQTFHDRLARLGGQVVEVLAGEPEKAVDEFRRDLKAYRETSPDVAPLVFGQSFVNASGLSASMLVAFFSDLVRTNPNLVEAHFARGVGYTLFDQRHEAIDDLTQVIRIDSPYTPPALALRGLLYAAEGDDESAQADFAKAKAALAGTQLDAQDA